MDVVAGFALGAYCLYFFPRIGGATASSSRIASSALIICSAHLRASSAGAITLLPWGAVLLWPTVSFAFVARRLLAARAGGFQRREGLLPWTT